MAEHPPVHIILMKLTEHGAEQPQPGAALGEAVGALTHCMRMSPAWM